MSNLLNFKNKTAAVIGASSGIGRAAALTAGMGGRFACSQTHRPSRRNRRRDFVFGQPDEQLPY
jgi:hypothetical protein|nr:hypothetical protein [uncultured Neisseria sp.]